MAPGLILALSLFYSENLKDGYFSMEKRLPYFVFPLVLGTIPTLSAGEIKSILKWSLGVCVFAILFYLAMALNSYFLTDDTNVFFWMNLSNRYEFHPSYFSIFILLNLFFIFLDFNTSNRKTRLWYGAMAALMSVMIILLSSKLHIILLFFAIIAFCVIMIKKVTYRIIFSTLMFIAFAFVFQIKTVSDRFNHINSLAYKLNDPVKKFNELTIRFALIECSWDIIKNHILLGVGVGDTNDELMKTYYKYDYKFGYGDKQNPHNQYLSILIPTGFFGGFLFLVSLATLIYFSIINKNYLNLLLVCVFLISFLVESYLERQKGIVLFYLFTTFLFFHPFVIERKENCEF